MSLDRLSVVVLVAAGAFACSAVTAVQAKARDPGGASAFTIQDLVRLQRLSDVTAAPDGKHVAYTVRSTDIEANRGRTTIWVLDATKRNAAPYASPTLSMAPIHRNGAPTAAVCTFSPTTAA